MSSDRVCEIVKARPAPPVVRPPRRAKATDPDNFKLTNREPLPAGPRRKTIFFVSGLQLRYVFLVGGSLLVLLKFAGLHGYILVKTLLPVEISTSLQPLIFTSTVRLMIVGLFYVGVVTLAAAFLTHRTVGPLQRLEDEIWRIATSTSDPLPHIKVREGDGLENIVIAVNKLAERVSKK